MTTQSMTSAEVPPLGVAGTMSTAGVALGLEASLLFAVLAASLLLAQHSVMVIASTCIALMTFSWTLAIGMGIPTLLAAMFGTGDCIQDAGRMWQL